MQATTPASVNHVPAWLVVASALRSLLIRFSTPITTKLTESSLRLARGASSASISRPNSMTLFRQPARRIRVLLVRAHVLDEVRGSEDPALGV